MKELPFADMLQIAILGPHPPVIGVILEFQREQGRRRKVFPDSSLGIDFLGFRFTEAEPEKQVAHAADRHRWHKSRRRRNISALRKTK